MEIELHSKVDSSADCLAQRYLLIFACGVFAQTINSYNRCEFAAEVLISDQSNE